MNWDQIEREWGEMARRVQSASLPEPKTSTKSSSIEPSQSSSITATQRPDQLRGLAIGKPSK